MAIPYINILTVFSSFSIIIGILEGTSAVNIDHSLDGEQFVEQIIHGQKLTNKNGYYVFTAPYRLCEGGCPHSDTNFAMNFPLYVGDKGKEVYKRMFQRDFDKLHSSKGNAPFNPRRTTGSRMKPCMMHDERVPLMSSITTPEPTTVSEEAETEPPTTTFELPPTTTEIPTTTELPTTTTELLSTITDSPTEPLTTTTESPITTTEPTTSITNLVGIRCPELKPRKCKRRSKVTPEIVPLEVISREYTDNIYDMKVDRAKIDSIALDSLYFDR